MIQNTPKWRISIDTGGTFTDCIATDPAGRTHRTKVLSNSRLRGSLIEKIGERQFSFKHHWRIETDIFKGYDFALTGDLSGFSAKVESIDFQKNSITLADDFPFPLPENVVQETAFRAENFDPAKRYSFPGFEITAHEEAPILAARLVTCTPLDQPLPLLEMRLGTTKGTNALLEKKGARTALLITKGFGDLLAIGTQQRPHLFQLDIPPPTLLYGCVFEVNERMDASGNVLKSLKKRELKRLVTAVKTAGVRSVAVALLHSWRNPAHELALKTALENAGFEFISLSHELMPGIKILPRAQTAVVDACLSPVLSAYFSNISKTLSVGNASQGGAEDFLKKNLPQKPPLSDQVKVMTSAAGLVSAAHFHAKDSLFSGPAGGVLGAAVIAQSLGFQKVITLDMGGTSTDAARFDGHFDYDYLTKIAGVEMASPCLAIETVAAGGGSICRFDGNKLCVGPESAGAVPGPACYGAGGPLAITDVNLLLGKLDPSAMGIPVSREKSAAALQVVQRQVFEKTGDWLGEEELLRGFEKIANEKMAEAIRKISIVKGFDPKEYALLAFGGAGGLHACQIAELLGIQTIILPYDGGLLSAFGIWQAQVERFGQRQVLKKLADCEATLPTIVTSLTAEGFEKLAEEGFVSHEMAVKSCLIYLRLKGQESSLEVHFQSVAQAAADFEEKYRQLFGHFPAGRAVEVESVKVVVFAAHLTVRLPPISHAAAGLQPALAGSCDETVPLASTKDVAFQPHPGSAGCKPAAAELEKKATERVAPTMVWDELNEGDCLAGEAILLNSTSTAFLEKNWQLQVVAGKNLLLQSTQLPENQSKTVKPETLKPESSTPIELELFTNRFAAIAEEMGAQLQRTAFSVNIKERLDFSCALLDADAELLVNAPHIPVHLGSLGVCARLVREKISLDPGDVVLTNHPKYGGSHLPDVTLLSAVYSFENQLIGYVINRAHHAEIGGSRPGSMPPDARSLAEEGVVILPTYLVKNGEPQWEAIEDLHASALFPSRSVQENLADLNAALASLRTGEQKLRALVVEHGLEKVRHYMKKLKTSATEALQNVLQPFENQIFQAKERLDDGHEIQVKIDLRQGKIVFDFTGTSPAHPFNLNANLSIVYSAVIYVLRLICEKSLTPHSSSPIPPLNEGLMQNVRLRLPSGTFLHPDFSDDPAACPAVVGGNTEVSQRLVDTLLKALAPIVQVACSQGTMNNFLFGNERFGYYETIGGGAGAGFGFDGRSAVHTHMTNTKITDAEELELRYPVRLRQFAIRKNSGGKGRQRGGDGIVREIEFLEAVDMTLLSQHRREAPFGLAGGSPGKRGKQQLLRAASNLKKRWQSLTGVVSLRIEEGDVFLIETPGGGGFGER